MMLMTYGAEREAAGKYIEKVESIRNWSVEGQDIPKAAAKMIRVTIPVFDGVLNLIQTHPDWDDRTVADQASWR